MTHQNLSLGICWKLLSSIERKINFSEIRLFLENHPLEFHEIWHENTLGISNSRYASEPSTRDN